MKSMFSSLLLVVALAQAQTIPLQSPGLQPLGLKVKQEKVRSDDWHVSMVSTTPPVIRPRLARGTANATDTPYVANLKDRQEDFERRRQALDAVVNKREEFRSRWIRVYVFEAQMKNTTLKPITKFVWAYRLPGAPGTPDQEYLCNVRIEPGQTKLVKVMSPIPRPRVVSAADSGTPSAPQAPSVNDLIIDQIQFGDHDEWRNPTWNPVILSRQGARKLGQGKCLAL